MRRRRRTRIERRRKRWRRRSKGSLSPLGRLCIRKGSSWCSDKLDKCEGGAGDDDEVDEEEAEDEEALVKEE